MNQSLDEFRYQDIGLKIESFGPAYNQGYSDVVLRVINYSDKKNKYICLYGSRYISKEYGILEIYNCRPGHFDYSKDKYSIIPNSFVDFHIEFKMKTIGEEDRFEIKLNNATIVIKNTIQNQRFVWNVVDFYEIQNSTNGSKVNNVIRLEHLEAIEERAGITLQNLSVKVTNSESVHAYCEVLSLADTPNHSFSVEAIAYNYENDVIGHCIISKDKKDFLGFEVFCFCIWLDEPSSNVERVLFYPTIS